MNSLLKLKSFGQSVWIDFIRRKMILSGELKQLIAEDGVGGVTSNPSIFEKTIGESHDYDTDIREFGNQGRNVEETYEALAVDDIQQAANLFRPVYDRLNGADGFVSLEVSPWLANNTEETIVEARRLWREVNRPNIMIKVPATREGLPAIRQLIGEGINVNITLLFGLPRYRLVAESYIAGLETLAARGKQISTISSVASFFLSRIDTLIDPLIEKVKSRDKARDELAKMLVGEAALSSAKVAYQIYKEIFESERFRKLRAKGARTQRLLWASTSAKNPAYDKLKYVEALIGPDTINTMPLETLKTYREQGRPAARLDSDSANAAVKLGRLKELGIDLEAAMQQLEEEGVQKFVAAYDDLLNAIKGKAPMRVPVEAH